MRSFAIMQEPGRQALARRERDRRTFGLLLGGPRPKRVAVVTADEALEALGDFVHDAYLATGKRSYGGHRFEWQSDRSTGDRWHAWNGTDDPGTRGRRWRVVVTLRNGASVHEAIFEPWPLGRWDRRAA